MQLSTGMQGHHAVLRLQELPGGRGQHIGIHMTTVDADLRSQHFSRPVERSIALQAEQRLPALPGQQPAQMAFAGTPVQPFAGRLLPLAGGAISEPGDLLPFASGKVARQPLRYLGRLCPAPIR